MTFSHCHFSPYCSLAGPSGGRGGGGFGISPPSLLLLLVVLFCLISSFRCFLPHTCTSTLMLPYGHHCHQNFPLNTVRPRILLSCLCLCSISVSVPVTCQSSSPSVSLSVSVCFSVFPFFSCFFPSFASFYLSVVLLIFFCLVIYILFCFCLYRLVHIHFFWHQGPRAPPLCQYVKMVQLVMTRAAAVSLLLSSMVSHVVPPEAIRRGIKARR